MSPADELAWHRDWRARLMSAMRLWFKPTTYQQACRAWSGVLSILNETPPEQGAVMPEPVATKRGNA